MLVCTSWRAPRKSVINTVQVLHLAAHRRSCAKTPPGIIGTFLARHDALSHRGGSPTYDNLPVHFGRATISSTMGTSYSARRLGQGALRRSAKARRSSLLGY